MFPRLIEPHLQRLATQYPVITLTGPRQSGKTTLCRHAFPHHRYISLEDLDNRHFAENDPKGFLAQFENQGVILDEIQRAPQLPSYIQGIVDNNPSKGLFILTGSQQFEITQTINQSLAGRTAVLQLLPLSLAERYAEKSMMPSLNTILYEGFYPRIHQEKLNPTEALSFYLSTYVERDIRGLTKIQNLSTFERFLKLCATQVGQLLNYSTLANDTGIDQGTIKAWISLLEASYILFLTPPHHEKFRKRLTKSSKLYFYDVGLAAYLLSIQSPEHMETYPLKGLLFENFIVTEFLKNQYNSIQGNHLYFFRDQTGNEIDIIVDEGMIYRTVEIKSSKTIHSEMFKGLNFYSKIHQQEDSKKKILQYLVYGGEQSRTQENIQIYSYQDLPALFKSF